MIVVGGTFPSSLTVWVLVEVLRWQVTVNVIMIMQAGVLQD